MSFIDRTYFAKSLTIVGVSGTTTPALATQAELADFIARYEPIFLKAVLGDSLYSAFVAGYATVPRPAKWTALYNALIDSTNKISPIANYCWYCWQEQHQIIGTASADIMIQGANSAVATNIQKYVQVNEDMITRLITFYDWLDTNIADYSEYDGSVYPLESINQFGI